MLDFKTYHNWMGKYKKTLNFDFYIETEVLDEIKKYYKLCDNILLNFDEEKANKSLLDRRNTAYDQITIVCKPYEGCSHNCFYCYDKTAQDKKIIDKDKLIYFFKQINNEYSHVNWIWHGGEFTELPIAWFTSVMDELTLINLKNDYKTSFIAQSSGTFPKEWEDLLKKYNLKCGISYDFAESRNYTLTEDQINKFSSIITVLNRYNINKMEDIYLFCSKNNICLSFNLPFGGAFLSQKQIMGYDNQYYIDKIEDFIFNDYLWDSDGVQERLSDTLILLSLGMTENVVCSFQKNCIADTNIITLFNDCSIRKCDSSKCNEFLLLDDCSKYKDRTSLNYMNFAKLNEEKLSQEKCKNCLCNTVCRGGCLEVWLKQEDGLNCLLFKQILPKLYNVLGDLTEEEFIKLNPYVRHLLIQNSYIPSSIIEKRVLCKTE